MSVTNHALVIEKLSGAEIDYRKLVYLVARHSPAALLDAFALLEGKPRYTSQQQPDVVVINRTLLVEDPDAPAVVEPLVVEPTVVDPSPDQTPPWAQPTPPAAPSAPPPKREKPAASLMRGRVIELLKLARTVEAIAEVRKHRHCNTSEAKEIVLKIQKEALPETVRPSYAERAESARLTADEIMARRREEHGSEKRTET